MSDLNIEIENDVIAQPEITVGQPSQIFIEQVAGGTVVIDQPEQGSSSFEIPAPIVAEIVLPDVATIIEAREDAAVISIVDKYSVVGLDSPSSDKSYVHIQSSPANPWVINHGMDKFPSVSVVDSANTVVVGDVKYLNNNSVMITFTGSFSGKAYLN